jgi:hypothetical protein
VAGSPLPLLDLYKIAIDEYRFEVRLGWDRTMYYLVLNSAIVSVGTGLLKADSAAIAYAFVGAIFALGFFTSLIAYSAIRKSHEYYRRTIVKKTLLEDALGLTKALPDYPTRHTFSIGTTLGQNEHLRLPHDTDRWVSRRPRRWSITFFFRGLFVLLAIIDILGCGTALWLSFHPAKKPPVEERLIIPIAVRQTAHTASAMVKSR